MPVEPFNAANWYWTVGGDTSRVYGSRRNIYVNLDDADYTKWKQRGNQPAPIASEAEVWYYVQEFIPAWLWNGTTMSQPALDEYTKDQLHNYNGLVRFTKVDGGMTTQGIPVRTDDRSRGLLQGARAAAEADPNFTTKWYGSDGKFYDVDAPKIIAMSDDVAKHTNDCYLTFNAVDTDIEAGTVTTPQQIEDRYASLGSTRGAKLSTIAFQRSDRRIPADRWPDPALRRR